jgi:hypothetical protein
MTERININHRPIFDSKLVIEHYEKKDLVDITYVCTTDLVASDCPADVFYRESPHPEFGNRYFGLYLRNGNLMISGADLIEDLEFGMILDNKGVYHYSRSHHDYNVVGTHMIDGGRAYIRSSGGTTIFKVKDGKFVVQPEKNVV